MALEQKRLDKQKVILIARDRVRRFKESLAALELSELITMYEDVLADYEISDPEFYDHLVYIYESTIQGTD